MHNLLEEIKLDVQQDLSNDRYQHTLRVLNTAVYIANEYSVNIEKVSVAAISHDITKEKSVRWQLEILNKNNINDQFILNVVPVMHSITGSIYIKDKYDIKDDQILNAVKYHTLGNPGMDDVAKVIYVADYIEPKRVQEGVEVLREMVGISTLDEIVLKITSSEINYLKSKGKEIHHDTEKLFEKLSKKETI